MHKLMGRSSVVAMSVTTATIAMFSFAGSAFAATTANGGTQIMIMTHLCDSSIQNVQEFEAMENGKSPIANLGNDVLHCPTTGLISSTAATGTIASPRTTYNFSVQSGTGATVTLQNNGMFNQLKACETDLNVDVNGDGQISPNTCLDISHYMMTVPDGGSSIVNVQETQAPAGYHFGILRFTPVALDGNNDSQDLSSIDSTTGRIDLNVTPDTDGKVMLHVYQFVNSTSSTPTPACQIQGNLTIGSTGTNVTCLQTYLMGKGYLSSNLPTGYFGSLTESALMKWQTAAGISSTGFFGSMSQASFNAR